MFEYHRTILQLLKSREQYDKLRTVVNPQIIDYDVRRVLNTLDTYWQNYPTDTIVKPDCFMSELLINNKDLDDDQIRMYTAMMKIIMEEPDADSAKGIIRTLRTLDFASELEKANELYHEGRDMDLFQTIKDLCGKFERDITKSVEIDFVRESIEEILAEEASGHRFTWPLPSLTGAMPGMSTGDQVILAARPGRGKTSLCAFSATHWAPITPDGRPIHWYNNEGRGRKIKSTVYRAALKTDREGLIQLGAVGAAEQFGRAVGDVNRIQIFDIHGRDYKFLERLIDRDRPAVVIFDMLDNVHGFADAARTDLRLEQVYQWARECAVIYDFLSIPTSQISVDGEGLAWCDQSMLKDSKTAKQGACDAIITMGAKNGPEFLNSRFLYVPKAYKGEPSKGYRSDCAKEVHFNPYTCQFMETMEPGDVPA